MLSSGLSLRVFHALVCSVCDQIMDEEVIRDTEILAALTGVADPYSICPGCHQEPANRKNEEYRRKCRVAYFEKYSFVIRSRGTKFKDDDA